jgi:regulator of sigma E protease
MLTFHEIWVAVVAFIILLGIMVVVHEFGHFAVAKLCGVRVEAFSVGFGPRLFGIKIGDTDYKVCILPFGGYVKMTGETPDAGVAAGMEEDNPSLAADPGAFTSHPRWQRMLIGLAGPVANFILAFVAMTFYYNWINEVPSFKTISIEWVQPESPAAQAGIQPNDSIVGFDGIDNPSWDQLEMRANRKMGQYVTVVVARGGNAIQTSMLMPQQVRGKDLEPLTQSGIFLHMIDAPIVVDQVMPGTPAQQAGLHSGDHILAVDGHGFHTLEPLLSYLQWGQGKPVVLTVERAGASIPPITVHPAVQASQWRMGFSQERPPEPPMHEEPLPFASALDKSESFCADSSLLILDVLRGIFARKVSVSQLSGPVGIARMAGEAAEMKGWAPKFELGSEISLNLGILNLMPFPILDGGMILLLLIESGIRRDINILVKERIYQAAFVMLVAFAAFIIFNDITKLRMH